jgi:3-oxoacyl-[acyl-carrier protein] reductase
MLHSASAVVTGASRGIGRAVAGTLAAAGARVFLISRSAGDLERVAADAAKLYLARTAAKC